MANILDKLKDIFKPKASTQQAQAKTVTTAAANAGSVFSPAQSLKNTQSVLGSTEKTTQPTAKAFVPAAKSDTKSAKQETTSFYKPKENSLASRAYQRDVAAGNGYDKASDGQKAYNSAYYKTVDNKAHTDMYRKMEGYYTDLMLNGKQFKKDYDAGQAQLKKELEETRKQFGENSNEYRALQQFSDEYNDLGRQVMSKNAAKSAAQYSRQMDDTIDSVFAGYTSAPDYQEKVEKGKALLEKHPDTYKRFLHDTKGASKKQMDLLYAVAADEDVAGAKDFFNRFLNPTVSQIGALQDFSSGIASDSKGKRFLSSAGAAAAGAVANSAIVGGGVEKGLDVLTGKAKALEDDALAGDFTVQDSIDNALRSEFAGIDQADLDQYGKAAFDQLNTDLPSSDWLKIADQDASDYQKQLLGYIYLASDRDEEAAKSLWEAIKARDSEIRQTVNGSTYGSTSQNAVKSQLYQEYLDKNKLMLGLYKAAVTTGSQLDRTALSFIPVVGTALSLGTMGLDVYGKTYSEDILNGRAEDGKTAGHAATAALLEVAMEKLLGGINHIPGLAVDEVSKRFVKNLANPWARGAVNTLLRIHGEGTEEALTDVANAISTGLWFGEGNIAQRVKQGFENDFDAQQMLESYIYGAISAFFLGGLSTAGEIHADFNYRDIGQSLNTLEATDKLIDTILNNKIDAKADKISKDLYDDAKEIAQGMKDGKLKKNDVNVGEAMAKFAKSGGDVQWLTNPDTVNYNKDTLTEENFIAGATSRLAELGADTSLAGDIARWAMGQAPSQEAFNKIKSDPRAAQVLQELIDPLDMEQDNALTRAVQSTTRNVTGDKTYDTLVASNPDQTVVNPATQQLISLGVELEEAQDIGGIIEKVMSGEAITEDEAELVSVGNAAVRSVLSSVANVELAEDATIGAVMDALNGVAADAAKVKEQQAAVAQGAEAAARARMPIPPNSRQTITAGGIEFGHDEFIQDYMAQHNTTLEQAEAAWNQRAGISAALNGEEENNGRNETYDQTEERNAALGDRGAVSEDTERGAGSGGSAVSGKGSRAGRGRANQNGTASTAARQAGQKITKLTTEQREFVQSARDDGFTSVTLIQGPLYDSSGVEVNAMVKNGVLTIRWDNPVADPRRIEQHEKIHLWLDVLGANRESFINDALIDIFDGDLEALNAVYKIYKGLYKNLYAGLSGQAFMNAVYEEMFADMYAGLDLYNAGTEAYQQATEMYVVNSGLEDSFFGLETASDYGGPQKFNVADPFRDSTDWDLPADVRPFPGEEPMHTQLERFSVSSMAQGGGFDLELNVDGYPYALIDKTTGERVTNVTGDMMKGTPLGDIVQMAVDNNSISETDARKQRQMLADAMNMIVKYNDAAVVWELAGSQMFSAIKSNSDKQYNKTIDFSTICKKTMAIVDAMSETMKKLGRGLTRREVEAVYLETGKAGEATPCPVCYVFSRWMGIGNLLDQMSKFQDKYAGKSEEELLAFMKDIEDQARAYAEAASPSKKEEFFDKNGQLKIGKVISDMKSKPNSKAASAIKKLNQHQQALDAINGLTEALPNADPAQAPRWRALIKALQRNVLSDAKIAELQQQMAENDERVEVFEVYQWLAKTVLMPDSSEVNEDGEAVGSWKKNPDFKPVPKDILFDLNRGGDFAKDYPLSWAFRTGKGCAMGKAITPYADARVGETIQGVDLSDVKNIRMGEFNEFLNGDVAKQKRTLASAIQKMEKQNLIGGMRYQSTSDFRYEFGSDYLMTFFEMQALGANVQLYTKVIEAVDFLASTGADCNLSVMPKGNGYVIDPETGEKKLVFSDVTGINAEAAIKKAKQYDNVQLILVGINDENVRLALAGTDVTFVIPFHGSGQSVHQVQTLMDLLGEHLDVTKAQDYTSVQSDHVSPKQTAEQKALWNLRMAIIMGECENGLTSGQQALLDKNEHLQKLYNMFYEDESSNAYHNYLAKDQAQQIFPYEYWDKTLDYDHADRNGEIFQEYCKSMGIIPRFSGLNSKGERTGFGDFTKDKGYWKLLIDRSMYRNVYDENGEWIGYGEYRDQQQINMSNVRIGDLDPETGKAQFTNGEMSKQYDATRNPADRQNLDTIVTNSIQRIEAMRDKGDVFDRTQVNKSFRGRIMEAQSELRGNDRPVERYSLALSDPGFESSNKEAPVTDERDQVLYVAPSSDAWAVARDSDGSLLNTSYIQDELGLPIYDNPHDAYVPEERGSAESGVGHLTANPSTIPTYRQAFQYLKNTHDTFRDLRVLDASSGQGFGTAYGRNPAAAGKEAQAEYEALVDERKRNTLRGKKTPEADIKREAALKKLVDEIKNLTGDFDTSDVSFNVTDLEPYHGPGHTVDYEKYGGLIAAIESGEEEPFDFIINNAVINVMAQDAREELLANLIRMLKPGGQLFINPAFAKEWDGYKKAIPLEEYKLRVANGEDVSKKNVIIAPSTKTTGGEIYTAQSKSIQKGYTDPEFMAFAKDVAKQALGEDIQIEKGNKLPGLNKGFVITRSESVRPSERFSVASPEVQQKNREFNERQTVVGSGLRTLNSDKAMTRSTVKLNGAPANVGKQMGDQIYVHKNYADRVVPADVLENAETILNTEYPGFQYNTIMYNRKTGEVRFDEAPNFDTAREPIPGRTVTVKPDGSTNPNYYDQIWHHKWMWVDNDYTGFDVADSWNWSKQWLSTLPEKANGSTRGPEGWNKQMDRFGLPKDPASEIEIKDKKAEIAAIKALRSGGRFSVAPTDQNNSTPFKKGSFEATVYDLIQKADDGQALQDTINELIEKRNQSMERNNAPVIPSKDKANPVGKVQREIQQNQLQDLIGKYGALKKGEKAAKDVSLPERTSDERYTRRFVRNTEEAAAIPERMNERIDDSLLTEDLLTYSRITDKMATKKGDSDFEALGYKKAIKEWNENRSGTGNQPTKYDIAFGERLMIEAARNGDEAVALKVLADLASMETQAGQVVQAARLLKKLGPTGQLYYIQKAVDRLNKQNEGRIAKGSMQPITIDKELAKAVILAETDKQMQDAMDELIAHIAEQLPVTLKDKWDAWRYLSMLGNPRTHIRNVFGNAVFSPIRFTKDLLASAGEKMFIKDPLERTKAANARLGGKKYDAVREFAASDFEEMKQQITGTGKMNPLNEIMDKRKIFKSKAFGWLNKLSDWNSDMLEKEDAIFLRKAYIDAMTQFIAAKGLTLEQLTGSYEGGKLLNDARQYAALEAQKATYRDFNQMASALSQVKRTSGVGWFIDGLMPFTKTPMNILRRGIEYSPVGLANGIYSSLVRVGKGDISAADAIDQVAAGMTGTGIAILGYFLAKMGLARGGDDDDDKKAQLESAEGHQNYSLEIPGYGSYTIDWMAPVALPFFVGVEAFNQLSDGGPVTIWDLANAVTMIAEPMMSLSMLDGLNSTLSAVRYGDKDEAVMSVATNILTSYLSQGAPTIFGQIARTIDPDRRSTYTDKNSATPAWLQRFVQGVQGKVPGVESQKMAYVDIWGRKDTNASLFWRALENFISPGYASRINETPVDRELTRLAESLGDTSVLPSSISKYYQLNGERLDLTAKQYEKLKTVTGQTAFSLIGNMLDDVAYISMGDEQKAAVIKQLMTISAAIGKQAVTPDYKPDAWIQRAIDKDNLETAAVYHALKGLDTGLSDYQLISAMDWLTDEDRGTLIMEARDNTSRNMTDYKKKKYKFVLTDEQIAREREIYDELFWPEYAQLISSQKYINADVAGRANLISEMQSDLGKAARIQLGDELRAAGYTSVLLDDSDVPEQVTDLYSLLNRG